MDIRTIVLGIPVAGHPRPPRADALRVACAMCGSGVWVLENDLGITVETGGVIVCNSHARVLAARRGTHFAVHPRQAPDVRAVLIALGVPTREQLIRRYARRN